MFETYLHILQLDSLIEVLSPYERAMLHKKKMGHTVFDKNTKNILLLEKLVRQHRWCAPAIKYVESRELKYLEDGLTTWESIEQYEHPIMNHALSILKPNK